MTSSDYLLEGWRIQPRLNRIERGGETVQVEPKVMEVLTVLIERAGEPVTRAELFEKVWKDTIVTDDTLTRCVGELRKLFGDDARRPRVIETIPRVGYRLIATPALEFPPSAGDSALPNASDIRLAPSRTKPPRRLPIWIIPAVLLLLVALPLLRPKAKTVEPLTAVPLTSFPGRESDASFSPGGDRYAFVWEQDLYVSSLDSSEPLRITNDTRRERSPVWSPDGRSIAFVRGSMEECGVFIVPALGGPERLLASCHPYAELDWHGTTLAVTDRRGERYALTLIDVETGESAALDYDVTGSTGDFTPRFSADGRSIAFIRSLGEGQSDLFIVELEDGAVRRLTHDKNNIAGHTWMPGGSLVFSSNRSGSFTLWRIQADGGEPEWMPVPGEAFNPAATNNALVYESWAVDTDLVLDDSLLCPSTAADRYPVFSPDGRRIAFVSKRSGSYGVWTCEDGRASRLVEHQTNPVFAPSWSPDSRRVAYAAFDNGQSDVYVIDEPGQPARKLTEHPANEVYPSWSRDGRWIYFASDRNGSMEVWKQPAGGGEALRVAEGFIAREVGDHLYFNREGKSGLHRMPLTGGPSELFLEDFDLFTAMSWSVADEAFYYLDRSPTTTRVVRHDGEAVRDLGRVPIAGGLAVHDDRIVFVRFERQEGDLMIVRF